jgi:hypothetical protein
LPRIDRIVVYIDDLDRCPPARVVEMLEAIHLLLAVNLFVVVVAIDPRWLLRSVAAYYRDVLDSPGATTDGAGGFIADDEALSTPAQYLEKIFQVVLTLPSLDTAGYRRMLRSLVAVRANQVTPAPPVDATARSVRTGRTGNRSSGRVGESRRADDSENLYGPRVATLRVVERNDPLALDREELGLLNLLGPPLLVATPRDVKRLANSYGLLTALRRPHRERDLAEIAVSSGGIAPMPYRPYRAGMVLLAALVAFPALGPALCLHLHREASKHPDQPWSDFCDTLEPQPKTGTGTWFNAAEPRMSLAQAQQWASLHQALHHVALSAAEHGLHLPACLGPWREWVLPAARLSFPAGRIVNQLHQRDPEHDS